MNLKRAFACFSTLTCALMLLVALGGCGPDYSENFAGDWRAVALQDADGTDKTATLEQLAAANQYFTLSLIEEEHVATVDMADQLTVTGTWEPNGETTCVFDFGEYGQPKATLAEDGTLVLESDNGSTMTYERF